MKDNFQLSPILNQDSILIKELELCQLRLIMDGEVDWFILVPQRDNIKEIFQLTSQDQLLLLSEINEISKLLNVTVSPDKINVAAIGNMVPQLHIHILARYKYDRAWPGTIWGTNSLTPFSQSRVDFWKSKI